MAEAETAEASVASTLGLVERLGPGYSSMVLRIPEAVPYAVGVVGLWLLVAAAFHAALRSLAVLRHRIAPESAAASKV